MATLPGTLHLRARQLPPPALGLLLLTAACHLDRSPILPPDTGLRAGAPAKPVASATLTGSGGVGGSLPAMTPAAGAVASATARIEPVAAGASAAQSGADLAAATPLVQPSAAAGNPAPAASEAAGSGGRVAVAADGGSAGTLAARSRRCVPGPYSGSFEGSVELAQLSEFSRVSGSLTAELTPDGAEGLVLKKAQLRGTDLQQNSVSATLTGRFSCITHRLEGGRIEDGVYHLEALGMDIDFTGSVGGTQADEPAAASGSWTTASSDGLLRGSGTWSLREGKD